MKKSIAIVLVAVLAGCKSDDAHSLSRDFRNTHNEALDALMMITSESRAKFAKEKIYKPLQERLERINKRMATWLQNTDDKEVLIDTLTSESVPLLIAECEINMRRLDLEKKRLERLLAAKAQDENIAVTEASKNWPNLAEFAGGSPLAQLKSSMEKGTKFGEIAAQFDNGAQWKKAKPPNFQELNERFNSRLNDMKLAAVK